MADNSSISITEFKSEARCELIKAIWRSPWPQIEATKMVVRSNMNMVTWVIMVPKFK